MELKQTAIKTFTGEASPEDSPVKDSKSNGMIENVVKEVQGMIRTLKDQVVDNVNTKLGRDSAIMPWLILHVGRLLTFYKVQADGKTAYQRLRGKNVHINIAPFGEKILYQPIQQKLTEASPRQSAGGG